MIRNMCRCAIIIMIAKIEKKKIAKEIHTPKKGFLWVEILNASTLPVECLPV